jgi:hypothetical protein
LQERIKIAAYKRDVPYQLLIKMWQLLIKMWLADKVKED